MVPKLKFIYTPGEFHKIKYEIELRDETIGVFIESFRYFLASCGFSEKLIEDYMGKPE